MAWVKLDDSFPDHPKVLLAGPLASWLHVCGLAYCNRMMTDGFIPFAKAHTLADFTGLAEVNGYEGQDIDAALLAERLCDVAIWEKVRGGYMVKNYLEYQPSRAEVESKRAVRSSAGKLGGKQSGNTRRSKIEANGNQTVEQNGTNGEAKHELDANPVPVPLVAPSRSEEPVLVNGAAGEGETPGEEPWRSLVEPLTIELTNPWGETKVDDLTHHVEHVAEVLPKLLQGGERKRTLAMLAEVGRHADDRLIDEVIGHCGALESPPNHASYVLKVVQDWAIQRGAFDVWPAGGPA